MTALLVRDDSQLQVVVPETALELKRETLAQASLLRKVDNGTQQDSAVAALAEIKRVLKMVEDTRVEIKAPILDFGRTIDATAKAFCVGLKEEEMRLNKLIGDFQAIELQKQRAAEALRTRELNDIERRTQTELAKADSHEQIDAIRARANEEARALLVFKPARSAGQSVGEVWNFEVLDLMELAMKHPGCVDIVPRKSEINALLKAGVTPAGVKAWKEVKSTVRVKPEVKAIEVGV
jgi:hypothetical protein